MEPGGHWAAARQRRFARPKPSFPMGFWRIHYPLEI
jgi:hypothetical protein